MGACGTSIARVAGSMTPSTTVDKPLTPEDTQLITGQDAEGPGDLLPVPTINTRNCTAVCRPVQSTLVHGGAYHRCFIIMYDRCA